MRYLTNHDLVWINYTVTGRKYPFSYAALEAAMAAQYTYLSNQSPVDLASALMRKLITDSPFAQGNRRTAFVAAMVFLEANGFSTHDDALLMSKTLLAIEPAGSDSKQDLEVVKPSENSHFPHTSSLREIVSHVCTRYSDALRVMALDA